MAHPFANGNSSGLVSGNFVDQEQRVTKPSRSSVADVMTVRFDLNACILLVYTYVNDIVNVVCDSCLVLIMNDRCELRY